MLTIKEEENTLFVDAKDIVAITVEEDFDLKTVRLYLSSGRFFQRTMTEQELTRIQEAVQCEKC